MEDKVLVPTVVVSGVHGEKSAEADKAARSLIRHCKNTKDTLVSELLTLSYVIVLMFHDSRRCLLCGDQSTKTKTRMRRKEKHLAGVAPSNEAASTIHLVRYFYFVRGNTYSCVEYCSLSTLLFHRKML